MPPQEMRGLTQFISDIRSCRVRELEEKRINKEMAHIRQKFKGMGIGESGRTRLWTEPGSTDGNLSGYDRKKYLAKICFTYILGYPVDIGHMEAVNLVSSTKYSEKQIVSICSLYARNAWLTIELKMTRGILH